MANLGANKAKSRRTRSWSALRSAGQQFAPAVLLVKAFERSARLGAAAAWQPRPAARARAHSEPQPASRRRGNWQRAQSASKAISAAEPAPWQDRRVDAWQCPEQKTPSPPHRSPRRSSATAREHHGHPSPGHQHRQGRAAPPPRQRRWRRLSPQGQSPPPSATCGTRVRPVTTAPHQAAGHRG